MTAAWIAFILYAAVAITLGWRAATCLGFILWGSLAAGAGYIIGASTYRDQHTSMRIL